MTDSGSPVVRAEKARHVITEQESGATCRCGKKWSFWGTAYSQREGTRYHDNVVPLLKATARRHARAANSKESL